MLQPHGSKEALFLLLSISEAMHQSSPVGIRTLRQIALIAAFLLRNQSIKVAMPLNELYIVMQLY